jgi:hypothetical protein
MALPKIKPVDLQYLDNWFSNVVDALNYDLGKIEDAVPTLDMVLTNIDTAPIQYLRDSLNKLVEDINVGFEQIDNRLRDIESSNVSKQGGK